MFYAGSYDKINKKTRSTRVENNAVKIEQLKDGDLLVRFKNNETDEKEVYHSLISIMSWLKSRKGLNPQFILEAFAEKKFWTEHVYSPLQGDFFKELERLNREK